MGAAEDVASSGNRISRGFAAAIRSGVQYARISSCVWSDSLWLTESPPGVLPDGDSA